MILQFLLILCIKNTEIRMNAPKISIKTGLKTHQWGIPCKNKVYGVKLSQSQVQHKIYIESAKQGTNCDSINEKTIDKKAVPPMLTLDKIAIGKVIQSPSSTAAKKSNKNIQINGNKDRQMGSVPLKQTGEWLKKQVFQPQKTQTFTNVHYKLPYSPPSIKNKFNPVVQQKYQKNYSVSEFQNHSPKSPFCYSIANDSPISMKTSYVSQAPHRPYSTFQEPSHTPSQTHQMFPIMENYYQSQYSNNQQVDYPKNQKMKYSMMMMMNKVETKKSMMSQHPCSNDYQSIQNYYPPINIEKGKRKNSEEQFLQLDKLLLVSRSQKKLNNFSKIQHKYQQQNNQKNQTPKSTQSFLNIKRIAMGEIKPKQTKTKQLSSPLQQHHSTKPIQLLTQKMQSKIAKNYLQKPQNIDDVRGSKHQPKVDIIKKKQALNNLKKQYQEKEKTNIKDNKDEQISQNLIQKNKKVKMNHLFQANDSKGFQVGKNRKMSLEVIDQVVAYKKEPRQYKKQQAPNIERQIKKNLVEVNGRIEKKPVLTLDTFSKKPERFVQGFITPPSKARRLSEPLISSQSQEITLQEPHQTPIKHTKYLDETMQTQYFLNCDSLKISDFVKGKQLGRGKFGVVNLARHRKSGFVCALKIMKKKAIVEEKIVDQVIRQIKIQYFLNHCHLVKLYGFFHDEQNIYLLLEYCPDGQLYTIFQKRKKFTEEDTCHIMRQLCQGISEMHKHNIIHRDMKPQNVVVSFGMCKICDFGWSIQSKEQFRNTLCGTPLYFSPELLLQGTYNQKVDIWALGMMAFQMITGSIPFTINSTSELMKIAYTEIHYPVSMSPVTRQFIGMFLQRDPQLRFCMNSILQHKFFQPYLGKNELSKSKSFSRIITVM